MLNNFNFNSSLNINSYMLAPKTLKKYDTLKITCRRIKGFLPSFKPVIYSLSITTSQIGNYKQEVYIFGENFLPNNTTYVTFGDQNLPISYLSSFNISFTVPSNNFPGNYNVVVVNIYNTNFSPPINSSYAGNLNLSNSITYTLT